MFSDSVNIDVQIYEEEIKKPDESSVILVPLKDKSHVTYQLVLIFENRDNKITAQNIDQASQMVFKEWQSIFPLYRVERAFADTTVPGRVEVYISFEAENIFSTTQTRNIKKTISEIIETELDRVINMPTKTSDIQAHKENEGSLYGRSTGLGRLESDSKIASALSQPTTHNLNDLQLEMNRQRHSLDNFVEKNTLDIYANERQNQQNIPEINPHFNQHMTSETQKEILRLQGIVEENKRYIEKLQNDYDQLREVSVFQTNQLLDENDKLKAELINHKNTELENQQEIQTIRNELKRVIADTEILQESLNQKLQRMQYENEALKNAIKENQQFEEKTQVDLDKAINELENVKNTAKQLETEKNFLTKDWELKYQKIQEEKDELVIAYKKSRELEIARNSELIDVKTKVITLEQNLQQAKLDYNQFLLNKEKEIKRLTDRLTQQKDLVEKLMARHSNNGQNPQPGEDTLALEYQTLQHRLAQLTTEVQQLTEENKELRESAITPQPDVDQEVSSEELMVVDNPQEKVEDELVEKNETEEVSYDDNDDDYDYDEEYDDNYDYEYDEDYDYEYHEVDDLVNYNPETIEEDIEELLDNKDDSGKEKISKKDYAIYELHLDHLKELLSEANAPEFKEFKQFADSKMKKYNKFKRELDDDVRLPKLFGRKYKLTVGLAEQMRAYVLISRHLSVLLDIDLNDLEDDYDYDYGYDYDYDYEYDYEEEAPKKSKKSKKSKK